MNGSACPFAFVAHKQGRMRGGRGGFGNPFSAVFYERPDIIPFLAFRIGGIDRYVCDRAGRGRSTPDKIDGEIAFLFRGTSLR